jgi:hypothetical protein
MSVIVLTVTGSQSSSLPGLTFRGAHGKFLGPVANPQDVAGNWKAVDYFTSMIAFPLSTSPFYERNEIMDTFNFF